MEGAHRHTAFPPAEPNGGLGGSQPCNFRLVMAFPGLDTCDEPCHSAIHYALPRTKGKRKTNSHKVFALWLVMLALTWRVLCEFSRLSFGLGQEMRLWKVSIVLRFLALAFGLEVRNRRCYG